MTLSAIAEKQASYTQDWQDRSSVQLYYKTLSVKFVASFRAILSRLIIYHQGDLHKNDKDS